MTRKVYIVDHPFPPTPEDLADAAAAGAGEVLCGIPEALAALGIDTFGYHEIAPPEPVIPDGIPMWRIRVILDEDGILEDVDAAVAGLPGPIQERWKGAPNFMRSSPLVNDLVTALGPSLGLTWEVVDDIRARAHALVE